MGDTIDPMAITAPLPSTFFIKTGVTPEISTPLPTVSAITGAMSGETIYGVFCGVVAPDPTITIKSGLALYLTTSVPTIAITGYAAANIIAEITAPSPTIEISAGNGMAITAPVPEIELEGGDRWYALEIEAPVALLVITSTGTIGILRIRAPDPVITITGDPFIGVTLNITAPNPVIATTNHIISTGDLDLTAPVPVINIATGGVVLYLVPTTLVTERAVVLNTDNWEVTEYTWQFDQLVKFGDTYLAVDSTGIYTLGGDTNNGTEIDSTVETGLDDFGIMASKRISNLYIGWKSTEDAIITVTMDGNDDESYEYDLLATNGLPGAARVKVGAPRQRKHINLKFTNQEGADFDLYSMEMVLSMSIRKVQGMG